jgi:hypothetical protein
MSALEDIAAERRRQVEVEGWTPEHDDQHHDGAMSRAAACYALGSREVQSRESGGIAGARESAEWVNPWRDAWPWARVWWKPKNRRHDLVRAGALIVAELERLDRASAGDGR